MINNLEGILAGSRKSYVLAKMGNFVLRGVLALGVLSYNGCASGENPSTNSSVGCVKDNECKGGRVCISGECVYPPEKDTYTPMVYEDTVSYGDTSSGYETAKEEIYIPVEEVYQSKDVYDAGNKMIKGDVNCDGEVTLDDANAVLEYFATDGEIAFLDKNGKPCSSGLYNADVNCDSIINLDDAYDIMDYVEGKKIIIEEDGCWKTKYMKGDVNCDGKINMLDTSAIIDYVNGDITKFTNEKGNLCGDTPKSVGDVNCDNEINMLDVKAVIDYFNGEIKQFSDSKGNICL